MAKVKLTDNEGNPVEVFDAQYNNRGELESVLVNKDGYRVWRHARDFKVQGGAKAQAVQPAANTQLKPSGVVNKPLKPTAKDAEPKQPVVPDADTQTKPSETVSK